MQLQVRLTILRILRISNLQRNNQLILVLHSYTWAATVVLKIRRQKESDKWNKKTELKRSDKKG
jgi:hypothetical protein